MHGMKLERLSPEEKENFYALGKSQIDYILGDSGRSFVVGFGESPPKNPHHRQGIYCWFGNHWTVQRSKLWTDQDDPFKIVYTVEPKKIIIMSKCH